ncbi:MAG: hypothetical protein K2G01_07000 [Paramuribaculum sp.]|nr:hypothetical protein [Paramuribaculum sp.]
MKKQHIILLALALASATGVEAQEASRSGYFLDGYSFRHQLNPAFANDHNYISVPALGNTGLGLSSNVGVNTFLYKLPDGRLTTFMSSTVSGDEFLSKIHDNNSLSANVNLTILSAGFKAFGGFNTISLSARTDIGANIPRGLLEFMKLGQQGTSSTYSFSDLRLKASAMGEIALGHSHAVNDQIEVGAKAKILIGIGNVDARIDRMDVTLSDDVWEIKASGSMNAAAGKGLEIPTNKESGKEFDRPEAADEVDWDGIEYNKFSTTGNGLAFDLGAVYRNVIPGLTVSASVLDLGFTVWTNNIKALTPETSWKFDGFSNIALDSSKPGYDDNSLKHQTDAMWDDLKDAINFRRESTGGSRTNALAATLHLAAEYEMPFYNRLTGGFLFTHRFNGPFSWTEGRISANIKPARWFDCSVNFAQSSFGSSFGWMINFHPRGFNFFVGSDHQFFRITPQILPVGNANMNLNLGFNVTFG